MKLLSFNKLAVVASTVAFGAVAVASMAITMSGALVTFDSTDDTAVSSAIGTGLQNLWA